MFRSAFQAFKNLFGKLSGSETDCHLSSGEFPHKSPPMKDIVREVTTIVSKASSVFSSLIGLGFY
jgi:hypothetical protein